jgi:filamentous hemagglutinin
MELTIGQPGSATGRRAEALAGQPRVPGKDLDEYPPAMFEEGGAGASIRPVSPADNRGAGACIGNQCRKLPPGTKVRIVVE